VLFVLGRGKTTLLKFLAARRLPVPTGVDVLLVEQEVAASDESVVAQVLAADTRRAALMAEEEALLTEFERQTAALGLVDDDDGGGGGEGEELRQPVEASSPADMWSETEWEARLARFAALGEELQASGSDACEARVRVILTGLGFSDAQMDGCSRVLSGGWRMRVSLARALFVRPKLLLLDEPTNHLDLNAVLWLEQYLATRWEGTVLMVSHDADFIDAVCTDVVHLDSLRLENYAGDYVQFEKMRHQIEARKSREYDLQQRTVKDLRTANGNMPIEKVERKAMQKLDVRFLLEKPKPYQVNFAIRAADDADRTAGGGISVRAVDFGYPDQPLLFKNLNFRVDSSSRVAIVGVNGAGKSTLLNLLMQKLLPNAAGIGAGAGGVDGEVHRDRRLRVGCYHQHFDELLPLGETPISFLVSTYNVNETEVCVQ